MKQFLTVPRHNKKGRLYFTGKLKLVLFFHLNPEILTKLFNLIYYLIPTLTLTPQLNQFTPTLIVNPA